MGGDPRMQRDGCVEDKMPEFVLSSPPPRTKRPPTLQLNDPTYSAAHMAEGQEAMWMEEEASCTSRTVVAALSKAKPASLRVEPPKKTLFNFLPRNTIPVPGRSRWTSRSKPPKKTKFKKIQKSVVLLPQSDGRLNPLVGANADHEAALNMNKARRLLHQALTAERGAAQLEDSEKMAKSAFVHAAVARRIMATVDEEATLDGYLENMSQKGEQAISDHQRIVFSMSFPDSPESKKHWSFSNVVDGYAAQAKHYLESILPKNVDPASIKETTSIDVWSQGEVSSLGFSAAMNIQQPLVHSVHPYPKTVHPGPPHPQTSHFSDVLSMSSLNEILDGAMEEEDDDDDDDDDDDEASDSQSSGEMSSPRSTAPVDIQTKKKNIFGIFSFGLLGSSADGVKSKKKGEAVKEDPAMDSRKENEDERKSNDSVRDRPDVADLECHTDGQDIETIAVEKFSGGGKKHRVMFGVIRKTSSVQGRQVEKQKPQQGGIPPRRQGGPHPTKQTGPNKPRPGKNLLQAMPKERDPGALQTLPSMPSRSINSEAEEGDLNDKYRTFDEVDSFSDEAVKQLESETSILGEAENSRAQIQRTAEVDNIHQLQVPHAAPTSPSTKSRSIASAEEEESQESIDNQDEVPAEEKIIPKRVRSLPKRLARIFGGRRDHKAEESASVETTPSADIQNAMSEPSTGIQNVMSEEKVIEKAISDGNMMALEANLNAEVAPRIPAQKPRLPPRSTRSVHSDVQLSVINVERVEMFPPIQESSDDAISYDEVILAPVRRQAEEPPPVPEIFCKENDEPLQRESSKAKDEPVREVKKEKNEPGGRMVVAKEKEERVRREVSKERSPLRREATEEKERHVRSKEREEPLRREASKEKDQGSKEKKTLVRGSSKDKEAPARRGASKEKEEEPQNLHATSEKKNKPIRHVADKKEDEAEHRMASKEKGEVDGLVTIKDKEVPVQREATEERDKEAHRVARKEMDANLARIMGEAPSVRTTEEEQDYNMRRSVSEGKNVQAQGMANREKIMQVRAVASQDAPGREAPGRSLKVSTSAKNDPPFKKGVTQNRNLAPTPRRKGDSNSRFDQRAITERLYGKQDCDMSYTTNGTTTIDGLLSQSESKDTYAPKLAAVTASYSSSDSGDGSETGTKASPTILSTINQLWERTDL
jgi:hypothetical protein